MVDDAILPAGAYTVTISSTDVVNNFTIDATMGAIPSPEFQNDGILEVFGTSIDNAGTMFLDSSGGTVQFVIASSDVTLSGGGTVVLSDQSANQIYGNAATATLTNVDNTISGSGLLGSGRMSLNNQADGTIDATGTNNALVIDMGSGSFSNEGLIEATGSAGLVIENTTGTNSGTIEAINGSALIIESSSITGGTVAGSGDSTIQVTGTSTIDGATINVDGTSTLAIENAATLTLGSTVNNFGTFSIEATTNYTFLSVDGNGATFDDGGTVMLSDSAYNYVEGTGKLTNVDNMIEGAGTLGYGGSLSLDNQVGGKIDATGSNPLIISARTFTNEGLAEATVATTVTNGVTNGLAIESSTVTNTGTIEATNGATVTLQGDTITNTGGTIEAVDGSVIVTPPPASTIALESTSITGGTLDATAGGLIEAAAGISTIDGATINVDGTSTLAIENAATLTLGSTVNNFGTFSIKATTNYTYLSVDGNGATFDDGGTVMLSDSAYNYVEGTGKLTNVDNTIEGAGTLGYGGSLSLDNQTKATIDATGTNALIISAGTFTNEGLAEATGAGGLTIENSYSLVTNSGTVEAGAGSSVTFSNDTTTIQTSNGPTVAAGITNDGTLEANGGKLTVTEDIYGNGTVLITNGGHADLAEESFNGVTFSGSGTLELGQSLDYDFPTITGFAYGDGIDLADVTYAVGDTLTWTQNGSSGTLKVALEGGQSETLYLLGTYAQAQFATSDDNGNLEIVLNQTTPVSWKSAVTGKWTTAADWSTGTVPGANNAVTLGPFTTAFTVTSAANVTINSIAITDAKAILSLTGTVSSPTIFTTEAGTGAGTNAGTIKVGASAALDIDGAFVNASTGIVSASGAKATVDLDGGSITGGTVTIGAGALLEATGGSSLPSALGGGTVTDGGAIYVLDGTTLTLSGTVNATGGVIDTGTDATDFILLDGVTINGGTLGDAGGFMMTVKGTNSVLNGVTLSNTATIPIGNGSTDTQVGEGNLTVVDGSSLTLKGRFAANDTLTVDSTGDATDLYISGNVTLTASGNVGGGISLSDNSSNAILSDGNPATLTNASADISGAGTIGDANLTLINQKNDEIDAIGNNPLTLFTGTHTIVNAGAMVSEGTLIIGSLLTNSGGIGVRDGGNLTLENAVANTGTIGLGSTGDATTLFIDGAVTLTAAVKVTLTEDTSNNADNIITGDPAATGDTLTNDGNTISGGGQIGGGNGSLNFVNTLGTVNANVSAAMLTIDTGNIVINTATLEATAGGVLAIDDMVTNTKGTIAASGTGSTIDLAGGSVGGGTVTINAGTLLEATGRTSSSKLNGVAVTDKGTLEATDNSTLILAGGTVTATGGVIEALGAVVVGAALAGVVGGGGGVGSTPSTIVLAGDVITGGTLKTVTGGVIETEAATSSTLSGVTVKAGSTVNVVDGSGLTLQGTITDAGTIALGSTGDPTTLSISGAVTLAGGGAVTLSDHSGNIITGIAAGGTLTDSDTISGGGEFEGAGSGGGALTLINKGTIDANGANALTIATGKTVTNSGTLEGTGTGGLVIADAVTNTGTLSVGDGSSVTLESTVTNTGSIFLNSAGDATTLFIDGTVTLAGSGQLTGSENAFGSINIITGSSGKQDNLINSGTQTDTSGGTLQIGAGDGALTFDNSGTLDGAYGVLIDTGKTVVNTGQLNEVDIEDNVTNTGGTIDGGSIGASGSTPSIMVIGGLVEDTGAADMQISNTILQDVSLHDAYSLNDPIFSMVLSGGVTVEGGTLTTTGSNYFNLDGTNILDGTTSTVVTSATLSTEFGGTLEFKGTIDNTGKMGLTANSGVVLSFDIDGTVTLDGAGSLLLGSNSGNGVWTQGLLVGDSADTGTLKNQGNTISGAGKIGNNGDGTLTLTNHSGVIDANIAPPAGSSAAAAAGGGGGGTPANSLIIDTGNTVTNTGTMEATAGGTLVIEDSVTDFSGTTFGIIQATGAKSTIDLIDGSINGTAYAVYGSRIMGTAPTVTIGAGAVLEATGGVAGPSTLMGLAVTDKGTLEASGGTTLTLEDMGVTATGGIVEATGGGTIVLGQSMTIIGGTLTTSGGTIDAEGGGIDGLTISAGSAVTGQFLSVYGTITNSGTIALSASGQMIVGSTTTLAGAGAMTLTGVDVIAVEPLGTTATYTLTNSSTIQGDAGIGNAGDSSLGTLKFTNQGTLNADDASTLTIDTGQSVTNSGILEATGAGGLVIDDAVANSKTIEADGGNVTIKGALSGAGGVEIFGSDQVTLGSSATNAVTFEPGGNSSLILNMAQSFSGTVAGLAGGVGVASTGNTIDLANFTFADTSITKITGGGAAGSITNVTLTDSLTHLSATLHLINATAGEFGTNHADYSLTADSTGHTLFAGHA